MVYIYLVYEYNIMRLLYKLKYSDNIDLVPFTIIIYLI